MTHRRLASAILLTAAFGAQATAQINGVSREQMWYAPTEEDWKKPCLITFQRTWDDAVRVSKETGKAILICVNMDGEIASEHYAGIRYRQPDMAKLYEPYVCVIASVYRHTPRDYDENGERILCPRFGSVTCGEHIAIEPGLYEKYFEGERVAPRHIGVELDGAEMYDVYYAFDTDSVFAAIRDGITNREVEPKPQNRGDRAVTELVGSADIVDREAVELAYKNGDQATRRKILEAASRATVKPLDVLRLALFGLDVEMARIARRALAQTNSLGAIDLILEALRVPMDGDEREALIAALERLGERSPRAKTLAVVHRGLDSKSASLDATDWSSALADAAQPAPSDWNELEQRAETLGTTTAERPDDPEVQLSLAEASLALAVDPKTAQVLSTDSRTASRYARLMFEDVQRAGKRAEELGASGWRVDAVLAVSAYHLGNPDEAYRRAERAMEQLPAGDYSWNAMAILELFAESRRKSIQKALDDKKTWPGSWLTDVHSAYSVLARHPLGSDVQVVSHYDFLRQLGAFAQASQALRAGLERFPESWVLHDRLRSLILADQGVDALEPAYDQLMAKADAAPNLAWFSGYTSIVAAEFHRRTPDREKAQASYERAIALYERSIEANAANSASADHYIAVAHAGLARLAYEAGDDASSLEHLLASFARKPDAAAARDGLNLSAVDTAKMLRARLRETDRTELLTQLQAALDDLDPAALELPAFERGGPRSQDRPGRRGRGARRGGR